VRLCLLGAAATTGLLYQPRMIDNGDCGAVSRWRLDGETEVLGEKRPQRHCVHHNFHMTRPGFWTRAAAVGSRRLTTWSTAQPLIISSFVSVVWWFKLYFGVRLIHLKREVQLQYSNNISLVSWGGVRSSSFGTLTNVWPIRAASVDRWWWLWSNWWNEDWQGKRKYSEKTCPGATLFTTNPTWLDPSSNRSHHGGKLATNRLSYVTTQIWKITLYSCAHCRLARNLHWKF
jgi:hypothetical protein